MEIEKETETKEGRIKDFNPRSFKDLSIQFGLAPTTVNQNYNEAMKYHKLRKHKKSKKTKSADPKGGDEEEKETSEISEEFSDKEPEVQEESMAGAEKAVLKLPLTLKKKPTE